MKKLSLFILTIFAIFVTVAALPPRIECCVGKKIIIGTLDLPEQRILANMLALMIRERTGTTVEVKVFSRMEDLSRALKKEKIQIYNEYLITAVQNLKLEAGSDEWKKTFKKLKKTYNRRFNLVWLKPYGFKNSQVKSDSNLSAAPLVAKQTLKLFPALPRLLNKLGGRVDDDKLTVLIDTLAQKNIPAEEVAREFLKREKLI